MNSPESSSILSPETQPNNAIVIRRDDMVAIVTNDDNLLKWGGHGNVSVVRRLEFDFVKAYVDSNKQHLDSLMTPGVNPGTVLYWERNYHDKLVKELSEQRTDLDVRHIGNALWALGY